MSKAEILAELPKLKAEERLQLTLARSVATNPIFERFVNWPVSIRPAAHTDLREARD